MLSRLEGIKYFIFAPVQSVECKLLDLSGRDHVVEFSFEMNRCECMGSHPCVVFTHLCPGLVKYVTKRSFEYREHLEPYDRFSYFTSETPMGSPKLIFSLPIPYPVKGLSYYLPIASQFMSVKCIDYSPSIDFSQGMCLWSRRPLEVESIVLFNSQTFVAICSVGTKTSDLVDEGQCFLTDVSVELSEKQSSLASAVEMQYIANCEFLQSFDLSKVKFLAKSRFELFGSNIARPELPPPDYRNPL